MKLLIDNRDLAYTIDTYGMFENNADESELEYLQEKYPDLTWDDVDWNFNHSEYVKGLAHASIDLLHNALVLHGNGIVKSIDFVESRSPQFYNYTTDSYTANWTINSVKLQQYINKDRIEFEGWFNESRWSDDDLTKDLETKLVIYLDYYTSTEFDQEDYNDSMFEARHEIGSNVLEYKIIDESKQRKAEAESLSLFDQEGK